MTQPTFPNLEGLDQLARQNGIDIKPTLARVLTDLYVQKPVHTPEEERHYTELVLRLVDAVDVSTRAAVAKKLATYPAAPGTVIRRLARDAIEVAEPILKYSAQLTGHELIAIIGALGRRHAAAIAARTGGRPASRPVPGHTAAAKDPLREMPAGAEAGENAQTDAHQREPDIRLGDLFLAATSAERRLLLSNLDGDGAGPPGLSAPPSADAIRRLETAALQHQRQEFSRELRRALRISADLAQRVVEDTTGEPLLVAVKALGMPADVLLRVILFLDPAVGESVTRVFDLVKLYDRLSGEAATKIMASLRATAPADHRPPGHQPVHFDEEAANRRRAAAEAVRRPAGAALQGQAAPGRRDGSTALPTRRQGLPHPR